MSTRADRSTDGGKQWRVITNCSSTSKWTRGGVARSVSRISTQTIGLESPDGFKTEIWCWSTIHSIDVYTMSQDESETTERLVRVRVYRGTDSVGLGERAFDGGAGTDNWDPGSRRLPRTPPEEQQLHLSPGLVHLQIFTEKAIQTVHYDLPEPGEYPISGPTDINVLILPT